MCHVEPFIHGTQYHNSLIRIRLRGDVVDALQWGARRLSSMQYLQQADNTRGRTLVYESGVLLGNSFVKICQDLHNIALDKLHYARVMVQFEPLAYKIDFCHQS